jgi:hypothetical protein
VYRVAGSLYTLGTYCVLRTMTVHIQRLESRITVYVYASHPQAVVCAGGGGGESGGVIVNTSKLQCFFIIFLFLTH